MSSFLDPSTLLLGVLVCLSRICDVSVGTMRTISIVHGRTRTAFFLAFVEIGLWLVVILSVLDKVAEKPALGVFYALGFAVGNVVGIKLEKNAALGNIILRVITSRNGDKLADALRKAGYPVTIFHGEGQYGPVLANYIVCTRRDLKMILPIVKSIEPDAFYITEHAGDVSKIHRPVATPATGWRAVMKKK